LVELSSKPQSDVIYRVALALPLRTLFEYRGEELPRQPEPGDRVKVPFGNRQLMGIVIERGAADSAEHPGKLKNIAAVMEQNTGLSAELLDLTKWLSEYYIHPIGEVVSSALPPYLRQNETIQEAESWIHTTEGLGLSSDALKRSPKQQEAHQYLLKYKYINDDARRDNNFSASVLKSLKEKGLIKKVTSAALDANATASSSGSQVLREPALPLNDEQRNAVDSVTFHQFTCYLLHGITGSGKTEVYLQLVARVLQTGHQALILVPEIGLSPQTVERFRKRFSVPLVELHSGVSDAQRAKNWLSARRGKAKIIIGTRLASLCALQAPGLIVIDEEHDSSFKQQDGVRYSARDASIVRAKKNHIPIVLGSATPSLETLKHAQDGHYQHLVLRQRATGVVPPALSCLDLCGQPLHAGLCPEALDRIKTCIENGEQALVFMNRRGYAPMQLCHSCGWVAQCNNCSTNMTLHQQPKRLHCHHCDSRTQVYRQCPRCSSIDIGSKGVGTEQLASTLSQYFPDTPIYRVDSDSTSSKSALKSTFENIHSGQTAILVGTQMIAKGHHFSNLKLVVIADADQGFLNPDHRAIEKMGQLLMQVAGRAGREQQQGTVLIQSHQPDHPLLQLLLTKGYTTFARALLQERFQNKLAPYWYSATFRAESKRAENAEQLLNVIKQTYHNHFPPSRSLSVLGPMPAAIERVQDRFRYQLQLSAESRAELKTALNYLVESTEQHALSKRVRWSLDIDPIEG